MSDDEWEVETILAHKYENGKLKYYVKWVGFDDPSDNTWEPTKNLKNCRQIITKYLHSIGTDYLPVMEQKKLNLENKSLWAPKNDLKFGNFRIYDDNELEIDISDKFELARDDFCFSMFKHGNDTKPISIIQIMPKDGQTFVWVEMNGKKKKIEYDAACLLFPRAIMDWYEQNFLKVSV